MFRAKYVVFAFIGVMMGYVLYHNERFLIDPNHPNWPHYVRLGGWLLLHGIAGGAALFLAPFQFSDRLRKRYTKAHRVTGRVYVAGVLVLAPLGFTSSTWTKVLRDFPVRSPLPLWWTRGFYTSQRRLRSCLRSSGKSPCIASG